MHTGSSPDAASESRSATREAELQCTRIRTVTLSPRSRCRRGTGSLSVQPPSRAAAAHPRRQPEPDRDGELGASDQDDMHPSGAAILRQPLA
eukprot:69586-Rhodomonas_salina.2